MLWDITRLPKLRPLLTHVSDGHCRVQVESVLDRFEARVAPAAALAGTERAFVRTPDSTNKTEDQRTYPAGSESRKRRGHLA